MAAEQLTGALILGAAFVSVAGNGVFGPIEFSFVGIITATAFAAIGTIARAVLDAKAARDKAVADGGGNLPKFDGVSLIYGILGCPLIGGLALGFARGTGWFPDAMTVLIIMGAGYVGRDGVNAGIDLVRDFITRKAGGK